MGRKKVWGLRTDCFNEEKGSFLVYVLPRPLAVSRRSRNAGRQAAD